MDTLLCEPNVRNGLDMIGDKIGYKKKVMIGTIDRKTPRARPRQMWVDTVKSNLQLCAPGSRLKESEDGKRRQEIVEAAKALNELYES